jgi:ankyrin repeat protein
MKVKQRRNLEEILQSVSDVLFPDEMGEREVFVNSRSIEDDTPLHVMAWRDDLYGVRALIEAGADVNATGDMGETALHIALRKENEEMVEMLMKAGANPDIRSEFGETVREKADEMGGVFRRLIKQYCLY